MLILRLALPFAAAGLRFCGSGGCIVLHLADDLEVSVFRYRCRCGRMAARNALSERPAFEWAGCIVAEPDLKSAIIALKDFSRGGPPPFEIQ
jgi:hypothetical protein